MHQSHIYPLDKITFVFFLPFSSSYLGLVKSWCGFGGTLCYKISDGVMEDIVNYINFFSENPGKGKGGEQQYL